MRHARRIWIRASGLGGLAPALVLAMAAPAAAGTIHHSSRASFDGALTGAVTTEGFEGEAVGALALPFTTASGLVVDGVDVNNVEIMATPAGDGFQNTTPGGSRLLGYRQQTAQDYTVVFAFPFLVQGVGFDISGYQPQHFGTGGFEVTLRSGAAVVDSFFHADNQELVTHFVGFVTDGAFDQAEFRIFGSNGADDFTAYDEVSFGRASVPEPRVRVWCAMLAAAAWTRRRS